MKVYVEAQSKAALIRRLAAGEEITGLNYSMFGGGGYYKLDNTLEDGTIIAIYSQMSGGNPVAKSWGTWTNGVLKAETFEAEPGWVSGPDAEPHPDLFDGMLLDEYQQVLDEWEGDENPPSLEEYFNEDYWKARDKYDREEEIAYNKYMEYLSTLTEEEAMEEMYGAETFEAPRSKKDFVWYGEDSSATEMKKAGFNTIDAAIKKAKAEGWKMVMSGLELIILLKNYTLKMGISLFIVLLLIQVFMLSFSVSDGKIL